MTNVLPFAAPQPQLERTTNMNDEDYDLLAEKAEHDAEYLVDQLSMKNDRAMSRRFVKYVQHLGYLPKLKSYIEYQEGRWVLHDGDARAKLIAQEFVESLVREAGLLLAAGKESSGKALLKIATEYGQAGRISGMLSMAQGRLTMKLMDFDTKPHLINFKNGTFDAESGEFRAHDPADKLTAMIPYDYVPDATCPTFEQVVLRMVQCYGEDAKDVADYLWRVLGYGQLGHNLQRLFIQLVGDSSCGKGVFLDTLTTALGGEDDECKYMAISDVELFTAGGKKHESLLYDIRGARIVNFGETEEGQRLNKRIFKDFCGAMWVRIRKLHAQSEPTRVTWMGIGASNEPWEVQGQDDAVDARLRNIKCGPGIPEEDRDDSLRQWLKDNEIEGILARLARHAAEYYALGRKLPTPLVVRAESKKQSEAADLIQQFIKDCCRSGDRHGTPQSGVNREYRDYAELPKGTSTPTKSLARALEAQGYLLESRRFRGLKIVRTDKDTATTEFEVLAQAWTAASADEPELPITDPSHQ